MRLREAPEWEIVFARWHEFPLIRTGATPDSVAMVASGMIYLATPYSRIAVDDDGHWSPANSALAAVHADRHGARLAVRGVTAVSPIVLAAGMRHATAHLDPLDARFWTRWCAPILAASRAVVVPDIPGWSRSEGVWHEVREALGRSLPVHVYARGVEE